jgi:hypothetical protein
MRYRRLLLGLVVGMIAMAACRDALTEPTGGVSAISPKRTFYTCDSGWVERRDGVGGPSTYTCNGGVEQCDGSSRSYAAGCDAGSTVICGFSQDPLVGCGWGGGGGGGGGVAPPEDSASYEEVVAVTDQIADEIDQHLALWDGGFTAVRDNRAVEDVQGRFSAMVVTPETVLDLFFLLQDLRELVVAGPNASRVATVIVDAAAMALPVVPSPGAVRILARGAKASKRQLEATSAGLAAARNGRAQHYAFSNSFWAAGNIGATRFRTTIPFDGKLVHEIDGAIVDRVRKTITIVELKPRTDRAIAVGARQLARYVSALQTLPSLTTVNKVTGMAETFPLAPISREGFTILREVMPRTY